ncbi:hypothetical protein DENSPDRAFT_849502 [Dentipellis sp. KUC8613]|nr:hypothetical protein DENSPDRAFT_849502 [Dentipellis sp. KUC8613]
MTFLNGDTDSIAFLGQEILHLYTVGGGGYFILRRQTAWREWWIAQRRAVEGACGVQRAWRGRRTVRRGRTAQGGREEGAEKCVLGHEDTAVGARRRRWDELGREVVVAGGRGRPWASDSRGRATAAADERRQWTSDGGGKRAETARTAVGRAGARGGGGGRARTAVGERRPWWTSDGSGRRTETARTDGRGTRWRARGRRWDALAREVGEVGEVCAYGVGRAEAAEGVQRRRRPCGGRAEAVEGVRREQRARGPREDSEDSADRSRAAHTARTWRGRGGGACEGGVGPEIASEGGCGARQCSNDSGRERDRASVDARGRGWVVTYYDLNDSEACPCDDDQVRQFPRSARMVS